jgi:hypothetical protein
MSGEIDHACYCLGDVIDIRVPVNQNGQEAHPPVAYLGQTTYFAYYFSKANVFMQQVHV